MKYFIIKIEKLITSFSVCGSSDFEFTPNNNTENMVPFVGINEGDRFLIYVDDPICEIRYEFEVLSNKENQSLSCKKIFEVREGIKNNNMPAELVQKLNIISPMSVELITQNMYEILVSGIFRQFRQSGKDQSDSNLKSSHNLIFFGPPGTGKSYGVDKIVNGKASTRTQFHPEYSYGDFVGSYRPVVGSHKSEITNDYNGNEIPLPISYFSFVPGPFMVALVDALKKFLEDKSSPQPHYLIVDEINRGDCSSIFGDVFQLLDRNSQGFSEYKIDPKPEIKIWLDHEFKEIGDWSIKEMNKLSLPPNFIILGTMNTSDQNLYPMDTAFKRRWEWKSCSIEEEYEILLKTYPGFTPVLEFKGKKYEWIKLLKELNRLITSGQQGMEDKQIGPWFIKPAICDGTVCSESFANKLLFYLWFDVFKDELDSESSPFINHHEKQNEINTFGMLQGLFRDKGLEGIFKPEILDGCLVQSSDVGVSKEDEQTSKENLIERPSTDESEEVVEQQDDSNE